MVSSCRRETEVERANREGILLVGNSAEPRALDLQLVSGVPESKILSSLYEGLIADHPSEDDTMLPGMAERWEHNEDFTEWTFHLRPDAKWSDGHPFTAADFEFSYHRMLNPLLAAPYASMLHLIRNAEEYNLDKRCYILCGLDPDFPIPWESLRLANIGGIPEPKAEALKERDFASLTTAEKRTLIASEGLDRLKAVHLEAILQSPDLFEWPDEVPAGARIRTVETLLEYIQSGEQDLYEMADVGIRVDGTHTLVLTLREPVPYLPSITRHTSWLPVPEHTILRFGSMTDRFTDWSKKENLVCNGPFVLHEWRYNHYIEVRKNPNYWNADNVELNGIRFYPIENPYTEARTFLAGQLHTTYSLPAELIERTKLKYPEYLVTEPYVGTVFLRFNTTRPGLDDPRVRKALSLAVNRAELCKHIYEGFTPATGLTPKLGSYDPVDVLEYDLDKARALLAEAGYPNGDGLPAFELLSSSRPTPSIDALQAYFRKLGVRVSLERKDWGSFLAAQQELNYDLSIGGWIGDYLDATTFLDLWTAGNGNNNSGWSSKEYEALLRDAAFETDTKERAGILAEAERLMLSEAPIIPIAWYSRIYLHRPEVKGWHPLVLDNHPWDNISLETSR